MEKSTAYLFKKYNVERLSAIPLKNIKLNMIIFVFQQIIEKQIGESIASCNFYSTASPLLKCLLKT